VVKLQKGQEKTHQYLRNIQIDIAAKPKKSVSPEFTTALKSLPLKTKAMFQEFGLQMENSTAYEEMVNSLFNFSLNNNKIVGYPFY